MFALAHHRVLTMRDRLLFSRISSNSNRAPGPFIASASGGRTGHHGDGEQNPLLPATWLWTSPHREPCDPQAAAHHVARQSPCIAARVTGIKHAAIGSRRRPSSAQSPAEFRRVDGGSRPQVIHLTQSAIHLPVTRPCWLTLLFGWGWSKRPTTADPAHYRSAQRRTTAGV
jgi:hypothetical protein